MSDHGHTRKNLSDGSNYGIFWDEYRSIEQSSPKQPQVLDNEDGGNRKEDKNESEIQWLNDVGFTNIAKKIRARTEIDRNDDDMKIIAASLTRAQANAVRKRIDSLNEAIRQRNINEDKNLYPSSQRSRGARTDVRNLFEHVPKTQGLASNSNADSVVASPRGHGKKIYQGQRFVSVPGRDSKKQLNDVDLTSRDVLKTDDAITDSHTDPRLSCKTSPTVRRVQNTSPQVDNLVRRTSGSHLIVTAGEERAKAVNSSKPNWRNTDLGTKSETNSCPEKSEKSCGLLYRTELTHRKTKSSDGLVNVYHVQGGAMVHNSSSASIAPSSSSSQLLNGSEKRLVIVDSKYINVNSVGDTYKQHMIDSDSKKQSLNNESSVRNNARNVHVPVKSNRQTSPTDVPDKNSFSSNKNNYENLSDSALKSSTSSSNEKNYQNIENITDTKTMTRNDAAIQHQEEVPVQKNEYRRKITKSPPEKKERKSATKADAESKHLNKSPQRSISEKHKVTIYDTPVSDLKPDSTKLDKTKSSPLPERKRSKDVTTPLSGSDDSKSLSSLGSLGSSDDLQLSPVLSKSYDASVFLKEELISGDQRSKHSSADYCNINTHSESPNDGLDGDAKLDVGPVTSPRQSVNLPDVVPGPVFQPLPNFTLTREELGMTRVGDLSHDDMIKVRSLALLELTALFDACAIPMNRRKSPAKQKFKDHGMFGVPLTTLYHREHSKKDSSVKAPKLFRKMLKYLESHGLQEEGILRIPGATARVKTFREDSDKNKIDDSIFKGKKVSDISTCLKQFLRDLPIPLLSYEYQNTFTSVANLPERKVQLQALNLLVLLLEPIHQETLRALLVFLNQIAVNESKNKMGLNNVAMIMAPNLFFQNNAKINMDEASKAAGMTDVLRMLIKYQNILWTIPAFMVGQIRYLYEAGSKSKDPKAVRKIIAKRLKTEGTVVGHRGKSSGSSGDELEEFEENLIIRVKAPSLNKQSMAVQLNEVTTAADVVAKFQWRRQSSQKEKDEIDTSRLSINRSSKKKEPNLELYLCETGGNIGERRLEPTANLPSILKINPNAEWVVKGCAKK